MALSKEQWAVIEKTLERPYSMVELLIDGYRVTLQVSMMKPRQFAITVFINGLLEMKHCLLVDGEPTEIAKRFWFKRERWSHSKKYREEAVKALKRCRNKKQREFVLDLVGDYNKKRYSYTPFWGSFRSLRSHLVKNNQSIELAPAETKAVDAAGDLG